MIHGEACQKHILVKNSTQKSVRACKNTQSRSLARLRYKYDAIFRSSENIHWLTDCDKFADVGFDPIVG